MGALQVRAARLLLVLLLYLVLSPIVVEVECKFEKVERNLTCFHFSKTECTDDQDGSIRHPVIHPLCRKARVVEVDVAYSDKCHQCATKEIWSGNLMYKIERWCLVGSYEKDKCTVEYPLPSVAPDFEEHPDAVYEICRCSSGDLCNQPAIMEIGGLGNRSMFKPNPWEAERLRLRNGGPRLDVDSLVYAIISTILVVLSC